MWQHTVYALHAFDHYFLPVHHFSGWTGKLWPPPPAASGWPLPSGVGQERQRVSENGTSARSHTYPDSSPWSQQPVATLWAVRWKLRFRARPPPHCPAPGSSSVCCRRSGLPGPPSTPGTQWHCLHLDGFHLKYQAQCFPCWPPSLELCFFVGKKFRVFCI